MPFFTAQRTIGFSAQHLPAEFSDTQNNAFKTNFTALGPYIQLQKWPCIT